MDHTLPSLSIIIPTFNRPKELKMCLKTLINLDYPKDRFEIIVVDDGSSFSMGKIITLFRDRLEITLCEEFHSGPAGARNKGVARAKGEIIAFTDDDCRPDKKWIRHLVNCLEVDPDSIVGGKTINALDDNPFSVASQLVTDYFYGYCQSMSTPSFATSNLAMTRRTFQDTGGFDKDFPFAGGEDREFCNRVMNQGRRLIFCSEAVVYHWNRLTFSGFWRQHFRYGQGAFWYREKVGRTSKSMEPISFYINLILSPFVRRSKWPLLMFGLLVVSQTANSLGFFKQKLTAFN